MYFAGGAALMLGATLVVASRSKPPSPIVLKPIDELARESDRLTGVLERTVAHQSPLRSS